MTRTAENGFTYREENGYLLPNVTVEEMPELGKYGRMRLRYIEQSDSMRYGMMLADGTLYPNCHKAEQRVQKMIDNMVRRMLETDPAPDRRTDPLGWTAHINSLIAQAEEICLPELYEA